MTERGTRTAVSTLPPMRDPAIGSKLVVPTTPGGASTAARTVFVPAVVKTIRTESAPATSLAIVTYAEAVPYATFAAPRASGRLSTVRAFTGRRTAHTSTGPRPAPTLMARKAMDRVSGVGGVS